MKKNKSKYYIFGVLPLISVLMFKNIYIYSIYWLTLASIACFYFGFPRNKNYYEKNTIRVITIILITYFMLIYALGILTGFYRTLYSLKPLNILGNIARPLFMIICSEIIRYIYAKNSQYDKNKYIFLTLIFIFLDIIMEFNPNNFINFSKIFIYICTKLLPIIARELVYSYITYKVSYRPTIIIRTILTINIYLLPIFPSLGNYLNSVLGILLPAVIYFDISKTIKYYDKNTRYYSSLTSNYFFIPITIIAVILIYLISDLGTYQLVAIASGSMEPMYYRGDAIIIKKTKKYESIKIGEILAFNNNKTLITHRVVAKEQRNNKYVFMTKGDNNKELDPFEIKEKDVIGTVKYRLPYVGVPSIWLQTLLQNK